MKHHLITTIAAVFLVGCATTKQSEPPTAKATYISIHKAAFYGNIENVKQHLANGTDANTRDVGEWTPLHHAVVYGHKGIVELLITRGADVNSKNNRGRTPLHRAANKGHKETVELLIASGADVNAKDVDGVPPLDWAHSETADLIRKHGGKTGEELKAEGK